MRHRRTTVLLTAAAVALAAVAVPGVSASEDPALTADPGALAAALVCEDVTGDGHEPVLLVHGTGVTPEENWGWGYRRALVARGFDTCWVTLPDRAMIDIQHTSEYVVHAVRSMHALFGRSVDVVGHSQGGLQPRWALRWWPTLRTMVDDVVTLGSPHHGTQAVDVLCAWRCPPAALQMRTGSELLTALNVGDETPGDVDYTSIATQFDLLVQPTASSWLDGAANLLVQDLCPGRPVDHAGLMGDAVTFALTLDALTHDGPGDLARVGSEQCAQTTYAGFEPVDGALVAASTFSDPDTWGGWDYEAEEPPLAPYAHEG